MHCDTVWLADQAQELGCMKLLLANSGSKPVRRLLQGMTACILANCSLQLAVFSMGAAVTQWALQLPHQMLCQSFDEGLERQNQGAGVCRKQTQDGSYNRRTSDRDLDARDCT